MFTDILTFEYDEIAHNFVSISDDSVPFGVSVFDTFLHTLDEEYDSLSFTSIVSNNISFTVEEVALDNVNFL